jgi:hypothetical protein
LENLFVNSVNDPFSKITGCRERGVLCKPINILDDNLENILEHSLIDLFSKITGCRETPIR